MGIGVSVFLMAVGAILAFAVTATVSGLDLAVVGIILMGAGLIGLVLTLYQAQRTTTPVQRENYSDDRDVPPRDVY